jgi:hypothetical protein
MTQEAKNNRNYLVEVWFPIEKDEDGYPESKNWEQLLARPTEKIEQFMLESIPFYLKNVSRGDVVSAKTVKGESGDFFQFDEVVTPNGHNTYRLLLRKKHPDDPGFTVNELVKRGLAVEEQQGDFLAVDAPPSVDQQLIDQYLVGESEAGRWEMQDGCLRTIRT